MINEAAPQLHFNLSGLPLILFLKNHDFNAMANLMQSVFDVAPGLIIKPKDQKCYYTLHLLKGYIHNPDPVYRCLGVIEQNPKICDHNCERVHQKLQ